MKVEKIYSFILALVVATLLVPLSARANEYAIDKSHSTLGFSAVHLMVSKTLGNFEDYDGKIVFDPNDLSASKIDVTIQAGSINTREAKRDEHLKTPDFFDVAQFPTLTFVSKAIVKEADQYRITGDLTIKGVTKEVSFPARISGPVQSPMGGSVIGIEASFKLNRQDYGITWNKALDSGGFVVSDDIDVNVIVEAHKS